MAIVHQQTNEAALDSSENLSKNTPIRNLSHARGVLVHWVEVVVLCSGVLTGQNSNGRKPHGYTRPAILTQQQTGEGTYIQTYSLVEASEILDGKRCCS